MPSAACTAASARALASGALPLSAFSTAFARNALAPRPVIPTRAPWHVPPLSSVRHAATPTIANPEAGWRCLKYAKPAPAGIGAKLTAVRISPGLDRRRHQVDEKILGLDRARAGGVLQPHLALQREHRRRIVGRRVRMGEAAADRAAVAHLNVADIAGAFGEQSELVVQQVGGVDLMVAHRGADAYPAALLGDLAKLGDARDVDQVARLRQAQLQDRQQAVAAREQPGLVAVLLDQSERFLHGSGAMIFEF